MTESASSYEWACITSRIIVPASASAAAMSCSLSSLTYMKLAFRAAAMIADLASAITAKTFPPGPAGSIVIVGLSISLAIDQVE